MNQTPSPQAEQAFKQALAAIEQSQWDQAKLAIEPYQQQAATCWDGCLAMGFLCVNEMKLELATQYFSQALHYDSQSPIAMFQLGEILRHRGNPYDALNYLNHLIKHHPTHVQGTVALGKTLFALDKVELSIECHERAKKLSPDHPDIDTLLANSYDTIGNKKKAEEHFKLSQQKDPNNSLLIYNHVSNRKGKVSDDVIERLNNLYEQRESLPPANLSHICYALAQVHEALNELDKAFDYYQQANQNELDIYDYNGADLVYLDDIKKTYTIEALERIKGHGADSSQPIFIVGMPRSGTTLTGQILASHSDVEMAGELSIMHMLTQNTMQQLTGQPYPTSALHIAPEDCNKLGAFYLQAFSTHGSTPHIIDKMPSNMIHIGLIRSILPNAKIIYCKRDPIDTCWSIWRQYFGMHHYRHDLKDLGQMYAKAEKLMEYWLKLYPDDIHIVQYEDMIADTETQSRALIDFCELEWQDNCLDFHKSKTKVRTASIQQVRQPIYKTSLKSWEPIKDKLQPLIDTLREEGIEV